MTLVDPELAAAVGAPVAAAAADTEALIKEARRLRRRRRMRGAALMALLLGAGTAGYLALAPGPPHASSRDAASRGGSAPGSAVPSARVFVPTRSPDLIQPTTLAALPNRNLLILDSSRDQILELRPDGRLSVFAGTGRLGFSGDGGPARNAELRLSYFSEAAMMSVEPSGSVDVFDDGNCRIRQITPGGIIRTILRLPDRKAYPHGTYCPVSAFAVSRSGSIYIASSSEIERVSSSGQLVWVAGAHGSGPYLTPSHDTFFPSAMAFDNAGNLYIWDESPKFIFRLTSAGKLIQLSGASYTTQLTTAPDGVVFAGTHEGGVQEVTPGGVHAFYDVVPKRVAGIHWGRYGGFQEDGIAVTKAGTIYVDNAEGNGYGMATVLVRISPSKHATLVPIRTPLAATLPAVDAPGFPASLYPPAARSRGPALPSCPSERGLEPFGPGAVVQATRIAKAYMSGQFASDIVVTDRSWWAADFNRMARGGGFGRHTVARETPAIKRPASAGLARACGRQLVDDSIAVTVGGSGYSDFAWTLYFLDRSGHPLVYDVR